MTINPTISTVASVLSETGEGPDLYDVRITTRGAFQRIAWIDVHPKGAGDKADFVRLVEDDGQWKLIHLTHNEVIKGEATFSYGMVGWLYANVYNVIKSI